MLCGFMNKKAEFIGKSAGMILQKGWAFIWPSIYLSDSAKKGDQIKYALRANTIFNSQNWTWFFLFDLGASRRQSPPGTGEGRMQDARCNPTSSTHQQLYLLGAMAD
jgi:hypothetical protein